MMSSPLAGLEFGSAVTIVNSFPVPIHNPSNLISSLRCPWEESFLWSFSTLSGVTRPVCSHFPRKRHAANTYDVAHNKQCQIPSQMRLLLCYCYCRPCGNGKPVFLFLLHRRQAPREQNWLLLKLCLRRIQGQNKESGHEMSQNHI